MVHLATHGFYCQEGKIFNYPDAGMQVDPLLMTGLVLATDAGADDGLFTAQEVVGLDLRGLDWVVLSACGSGLGRLIFSEGLFGLRRAFEIAGARTVVMAMWKIEDLRMRTLMAEIYRRRLAGSSSVDAIREAQLAQLRLQREHLNRIHPILWGGIVAEGDWR